MHTVHADIWAVLCDKSMAFARYLLIFSVTFVFITFLCGGVLAEDEKETEVSFI